jgi:hypothetical protein
MLNDVAEFVTNWQCWSYVWKYSMLKFAESVDFITVKYGLTEEFKSFAQLHKSWKESDFYRKCSKLVSKSILFRYLHPLGCLGRIW